MENGLLKTLYFGKDDAESDIAKGGLLKAGFLRTAAFEEALSGTKSLIIGRKGAGKSAICLMLQATLSQEQRVCLVTPDEISADEIRRFQLPGIQPTQSKQLLWRYVFSIQIAKYLISIGKNKSTPSADLQHLLATVRRFLVDNNEVDDLSIVERFWRVVERLKGSISLEAFGAKIGAGLEAPSSGIRINNCLELIENNLSKLADALRIDESSESLYLLVDQIERIWSNDSDSDTMVVGVLLASKFVHSKWPWARCVVFLRADIYEKLQFADRDKFRGDEFHINWDQKQLLQLLEARAGASSSGTVTPERLWTQVFPSGVGEQDTKTYLVGRTLMRPRDIIQLCNACRDTAKTNGNPCVSEEDVRQALALYSNWKLSDLQNEWIVNYPFLPDLFVLLADNSYLVTRELFAARLGSIEDDLVSRYPAVGQLLSCDALLSVLYGIGLFGVVRKGVTRYAYQEKLEGRLQQMDDQFAIHPCFRPALQSTSAIDLRPFEKLPDIAMLESYRTKVRRGLRIGVGESLRGPHSSRSLFPMVRNLRDLRTVISKTRIQDEVIEEIGASLAAMEEELDDATGTENLDSVRLACQRSMRYLQQLTQKLLGAQLVSEKDDLWYRLIEASEGLERFASTGQAIDDYLR